MSYRSHTAAPSRVFDHLYDPLFTTSDLKNVFKENCIALTHSAPIHVYPVYNSMFSELTHEQRNCYAYQKNVLPHVPYDFPKKLNSLSVKKLSVTGADRSKFFSNPMGNIRTINVGLMADESLKNIEETNLKYRSTSIQTTFRESSAQTRPWLPEIASYTEEHLQIEMPELVYIGEMVDSVSYPGLREVEIVERARKRRRWEMALPPIIVVEDIPSRCAALEAFEWQEWIAREKEINECQHSRLQIVADLISKREQKLQDATHQKLENCRKRILLERKHRKDILIRNFQRSSRKLDLAQRKESNKEMAKDPVVKLYDNYSSCPKIRIDAVSKKRTQIEYTSKFESNSLLQDTSGVGDLQKYLKSNKKDLWLPKEQTKEIERGIRSENYLKTIHESLKQFRKKKVSKRKRPTCLVHDEESNERSTSVSVQAPDVESDEIYQRTVYVQKTIKGRAIQSLMLKDMNKFQQKIDEVKENHSIAAIKNLFPKDFSSQIDIQENFFDEYKRIEETLKNSEKLQEELTKVGSKNAEKGLKFLEKELQRLEGDKRAHALFLLAERERYSREAASLGKLKIEDQFRNDAITLYLEDILLEGVNRVDGEGSRELIRKIAKKIDRKASRAVTFEEQIEDYSDESNTEDVSELSTTVNEIPIQKVKRIDRIKSKNFVTQQQKYLEAAHQELFRDEFQQAILDKERQMYSEIMNEMIDSATVEYSRPSESRGSAEAEVLASQIVEHILNEIIESNFEFSKSSTENSSSHGSYDGDYSNVQSTSDADSDLSTEALANKVVHSILNDILMKSFSSSTLITDTETQSSDSN